MSRKNSVSRRIIALVIANAEMSAEAVAQEWRHCYPTDVAPPLLRLRVALCQLAEYGWLKARERNGVVFYRYARRHPPSANTPLFSNRQILAARRARGAKALSSTHTLHACFFALPPTTLESE